VRADLPQAQSRQVEAGNRDPLVPRQEPGADLPNRQMLERRDPSGDLALAVGLPRDQFAHAGQDPRARGPRH
jgi:hypothetical protein